MLVTVAAALWGTDAVFRRPLAGSTGVATIVFGEHVLLTVLVLPFVVAAVGGVARLGVRAVAAAVTIGVGASALATILFTEAFVRGDAVTPLMIQKVQPLVAVAGARLILGEHPRPRFAWYVAAALGGTWLIAFPDAFDVSSDATVVTGVCAFAAACLWAFGTVLGRYLARSLSFVHVATLRFVFGLPASAIALLVLAEPAVASAHDSLWIAMLALITGAIALGLYYLGLRGAPAVAASVAELAFPVTAAVIGFTVFDARLTASQWLGVGLVTVVVAVLPLRPHDAVDALPSVAPA